MKLESAFFSHAGPKHGNEDAVLSPFQSGDVWWAAIADGVGGHEGGGIASQAVMEQIRSLIGDDPGAGVESLFEVARERLREIATNQQNLAKMGTTLSVVKLAEGVAEAGHVGDTRVYHLRDQGILDRTEDQTEIQQLIKQGVLSKARAKRYARRSVLLSVLAPEKEYEIYKNVFEIRSGDRLILLSDGVYNKIGRREIRDLSLVSSSSQELCDRLEREVVSRAPEDDYTAMCVTVRS
jgi:serine/threonine protein phosphatase PrpC